MNNIFLIGFMGVGKSTVGWELARLLHRRFIDSDQYLTQQQKMSISEIFAAYGEEHFRAVETACIRELSAMKRCVISCGGGVVLRGENVAAMKEGGVIVLLEASPEAILERVSRNNRRPLLEGKKNIEDIREMMDARLPFYQRAADHVVRSEQKTTKDVAKEIADRLGIAYG
ncbi:MAG: shikimate kinase [Lachnospiraceae bacterium]|nr:shikimate kinase [Lachnospiraceae bacterium]